MKASKFVKKNGWDEAKRIIKLTIGEFWADHYDIKEDSIGTAGTIYSKRLCEHNDNFVCLRDLKLIVESHELVDSCGGLGSAKDFLIARSNGRNDKRLTQAIDDVESCL